MKRQYILPILGCGLTTFVSCGDVPIDDDNTKKILYPTKQNVIVIITDQQAYNTISALSSTNTDTYSKTPNIDRLVKSGVSFTNTYCANPVSVPSRFSMYTGVYGSAYSVRENTPKEDDPIFDETKIRSLMAGNAMGNVFKKGGYETYYAGKVHLPFSSGEQGVESMFRDPEAYGFVGERLSDDQREGLGTDVAKFITGRDVSENYKPFLLVANFVNPHDICAESSTNPYASKDIEDEEDVDLKKVVLDMRQLVKNHGVENLPLLPEFPNEEKYTDQTVGYPKFLNNSFRDEYPADYWREYRFIYAGMVNLVDQHIGEILSALDANPELKSNTIIVFTSDHGEMQGSHTAVTKNLPYEECQRVPFIFSGKGVVGADRTEDALVCNGVDLLPTLCDLVGIALPEIVDGISLASYIRGEKNTSPRTHLHTEGDKFYTVIQGDYKYTYFDDIQEEMLINLKNDPRELKNIAIEFPSEASRMKELLKKRVTL